MNSGVPNLFIARQDVDAVTFFPQPLVDGFSKLWLRGKGNLRVETLIPACAMMGLVLARAHGQKHQYLYGFLQSAKKTCKKHAKTATFRKFSAKKR